MTVLVTGAAGFIGFHTVQALLKRGENVIGIDNLNDYYDVNLKQARLDQLLPQKNFQFFKMDVSDKAAIATLPKSIDRIIHLAAQAGVRYSLKNPQAYIDSNITGHLTMLELARNTPALKHFVYASSSSVYGGNT
ncbi:MAG: SDR family NAD(P)-dependent oxidoreductase, partial [Alphaproteobacteria bacterium]|nr:SDR family NAD(P)-dependent oxidoreductase [Alphaproteobacteria bacterium]